MLMRVVKLGLMTLIGYAAYQFIRGMMEGEEAIGMRRGPSESRAGRPVMTGGGSGRVMTTDEGMGTSAPHRVGRGVVRR